MGNSAFSAANFTKKDTPKNNTTTPTFTKTFPVVKNPIMVLKTVEIPSKKAFSL